MCLSWELFSSCKGCEAFGLAACGSSEICFSNEFSTGYKLVRWFLVNGRIGYLIVLLQNKGKEKVAT